MYETIGTFELILGGSILIFIISGFFVIMYYHFSRKMMVNRLQKNQMILKHQKELLKNELMIIEKERKRIARDLHDEIGANLAYIGINLAQLTKECSENNKFLEKLALCQTQLNHSIADVRRISHDLLPPILDMFGLVPSIEEFLNNLDTSFEFDYHYDEIFNQLNSDTSLQLYRVILELVNNSIKHSGGNKISIEMIEQRGVKILTVSDNGRGYLFDEKLTSHGLGLKNISVRLESIGAKYTFNANCNDGFWIKIILNEESWQTTL